MRAARCADAIFACALLVKAWLCCHGFALAQERGVSLDDLTALRDFAASSSPLTLSSDGSRIALVTRTVDLARDNYAHEVHVVETVAPFGERIVARAGDIVLHAVRGRRSGMAVERVVLWSPDDAWIAYLVGRGGYAELWCVRSTGGGARRVSAIGEHVVDFSWAPGGALLYRSAISREDREAQWAEASRYGFHADDRFEPLYDVALRIDDSSPVSAWRVDIRTGRRTHLDLNAEAAAPSAVRIAPADARFANAQSPELALEADRDGALRRCSHALCQGDLVAAWPEGNGAVAFQRRTGHHGALSELAIWSLPDDSVRSVRVTEARLNGCVYDRARFFCLEDAPTQPRRLVAIDARSGAVQIVWDPNPSWARRRFPRIERLDTINPTGEASFAHLVYPLDYVSGRRYPLVIVQYCSRGFLRGGTGGEYPILPLSARGYFVLSVDRPEDVARARTMTSNELLVAAELDGSEHAMKATAIERFLVDLELRGLIDPDRIAVTGMSDGGETLFHLLLTSDRRFAAAITSSPPPDPSAWPLLSRQVRATRGQHGAMAPWSEDAVWAEYWRRISAIHHTERMRTPVLFNLSETETLPAMPLIARLQEMAAPHDLYVYPGAHHNKWRPTQLRAAQMRAIAWLDLWLQDVDTPDPHESDRAGRWRAMHEAARSRALP
jgi:dipeptidyl aminopeptidase/acylaminoacyl peptidase